MRKLQATLTRILIVLESVTHGLSENSGEISRKARRFEGFLRPKSNDLQKKKKKKRSSPKLRLILRPNSGIQTFEGGLFSYGGGGGLFSYGGGAIFNFSQKIGLKSIKNMRFCILHKPMGGGSSPPCPRYWWQNWINIFYCKLQICLKHLQNTKHLRSRL